MKFGARNQLIGKVRGIKKSGLMCEVNLDIPERSSMSSVMTLDSLKELKLKKGDKVRVIVKAVSVLLVKE
jgi:molybdopterin-binding protein